MTKMDPIAPEHPRLQKLRAMLREHGFDLYSPKRDHFKGNFVAVKHTRPTSNAQSHTEQLYTLLCRIDEGGILHIAYLESSCRLHNKLLFDELKHAFGERLKIHSRPRAVTSKGRVRMWHQFVPKGELRAQPDDLGLNL